MIALGVLVIALALTWRRRHGGLVPLALAIVLIAPYGLPALAIAEILRRHLARPDRVRRSLALVGLGPLCEGHALTVERLTKGNMNSVVRVTLERPGTPPIRLALKHMLHYGTLLAWGAKRFSTQRDYPRGLSATRRVIREVRALLRLEREGLPAPRLLGFSIRHRLIATEWVDGADLAVELSQPTHAAELGRLLARMHAVGFSMGDANPRNMVVDGSGRIVPFDLEVAHMGGELTVRRQGFDLAWAEAFIAEAAGRDAFFHSYGPRSAELERAMTSARRHLARFEPLLQWEARRWSRPQPEALS
jgi:hypothetical protein